MLRVLVCFCLLAIDFLLLLLEVELFQVRTTSEKIDDIHTCFIILSC